MVGRSATHSAIATNERAPAATAHTAVVDADQAVAHPTRLARIGDLPQHRPQLTSPPVILAAVAGIRGTKGRYRPGAGEGMALAPRARWVDGLDHRAWLANQLALQLRFGRRFPHPVGGAAYLDDAGAPDLGRPVHTWVTARMAHVYSLGHLVGPRDARRSPRVPWRGCAARGMRGGQLVPPFTHRW